MVTVGDLDDARTLYSERVELEPLCVEHADEMAPLLDDESLHTFIGGKPATLNELRARYARQVVGRSPDQAQRWLNWVVRRRDNGQAVGTTQATVSERDDRLVADVAWVIGARHHRQGYTREATQTMVQWLQDQGVEVVFADVHPRHQASMAVARGLGMTPTHTMVDEEVRWRSIMVLPSDATLSTPERN